MTESKAKPVARYKALVDMSLRQRPDRACDDWFDWKAGEVFEPPAHMNIERCLERGIIEAFADGGKSEVTNDG